jgi:hypothetical protein
MLLYYILRTFGNNNNNNLFLFFCISFLLVVEGKQPTLEDQEDIVSFLSFLQESPYNWFIQVCVFHLLPSSIFLLPSSIFVSFLITVFFSFRFVDWITKGSLQNVVNHRIKKDFFPRFPNDFDKRILRLKSPEPTQPQFQVYLVNSTSLVSHPSSCTSTLSHFPPSLHPLTPSLSHPLILSSPSLFTQYTIHITTHPLSPSVYEGRYYVHLGSRSIEGFEGFVNRVSQRQVNGRGLPTANNNPIHLLLIRFADTHLLSFEVTTPPPPHFLVGS